MGKTLAEILMNRDTIIFLLQRFGFAIKMGISQLEQSTEMEFLGVKTNSVNMTMHLSEEKKTKLTNLCENFLKEKNVSLKELTSLAGKLMSIYQGVLPAPLQCRSLQMPQILKLKGNYYNEDRVQLNPAALEEPKR